VRPRTKEFCIAWPCFGIAWLLCQRGAKRRAWPFVLLSVVGFSSVVNSFCHSRTPVWVSGVRGALGLLIGLAVALVLTALFHKSKTTD
jgi:mannose/fructose/N-acetylgalactosamine-specific phosphotransferase system component IIC